MRSNGVTCGDTIFFVPMVGSIYKSLRQSISFFNKFVTILEYDPFKTLSTLILSFLICSEETKFKTINSIPFLSSVLLFTEVIARTF